jgi:excisionase family DNA binding protein
MKPTDVETLVWTRPEAALRLKCGLTKLDKLIRSGQLPARKIGGTRVIRESDLREYVASLPVDVPAATAAV